jgi:hypothetical protein
MGGTSAAPSTLSPRDAGANCRLPAGPSLAPAIAPFTMTEQPRGQTLSRGGVKTENGFCCYLCSSNNEQLYFRTSACTGRRGDSSHLGRTVAPLELNTRLACRHNVRTNVYESMV